MTMTDNASHDKRQAALDYHAFPTPGKLAVISTKQVSINTILP